MPKSIIILLAVLWFTPARSLAAEEQSKANAFRISSPVFQEGGMIPAIYTCEGRNASPDLKWVNVPKKTKSLVLLVEDPDAPFGTFVHWVLFNLSPRRLGLPGSIRQVKEELIKGERMVEGHNGAGKTGYTGPCPPSGTHRYFFRLLALDRMLKLKPGATRDQVLAACEGHVIAEAVTMGKYKKK